ncbi:uncharacterized protein CC84DRAFT_1164594 [Paraphaeosphaeria sporulosa]|uniref:NB-ARC domain-containing protein n=1 Tax=Paraphaeosphaeria sporulosa TaxID=1460663 RepID=A0A177CHL7_9PLEO|nr:uncharacterized protein CC84DRAFT_1164594 [Paraphaeosphaeria sporulosa]OAG06290.1 hypothetical protein CC84DRAFT_1164594 [Paraphaeosphaeria sporulosa]
MEIDAALRECLRWLSLDTNQHWLLVFDNVDRHHNDQNDTQANNVRTPPQRRAGSVLITSRLACLQRLGSGLKLGIVEREQASAILETNAVRTIEGKIYGLFRGIEGKGLTLVDADIILKQLTRIPLALTQARLYI